MNADPRFAWTGDRRLKAILAALQTVGEARFVGGCVRDSLLGLSPLNNDAIDIDIAVTLTPPQMKAAFASAGIKAIATGEEHGTITAVTEGLVAECTTLRADVETDGRHAEVRFTTDWDEDWRRRDFTINALYADEKGAIWDPAHGLKDLEVGHVRFIGDAATRIKEDALRILRFFRFSARFARKFDEIGVAAIKANAELLDGLSRERVWSELSRTFAARRAPEAFALADELGVLSRLVPSPAQLDDFSRLVRPADLEPALATAVLWPGLKRDVLISAFKPSSAFLDQYSGIQKAAGAISEKMSVTELLYRFGREVASGAAQWLLARDELVDPALTAKIAEAPVPVLPFSGKDIVAQGVDPGPEVGKVLAAFERLWLDQGAPTDDEIVRQLLNEALGR